MELELNGQVAVVTGGGMGIGQAIALELAKEGAHISILDINAKAAEETAIRIEGMGRRTLIFETDVSNPLAVEEAVEGTLQSFGRIDILINNAGIRHPSVSILDLDLESLEKVIGVDFKGVYFCSQRIGKELVRQGSGSIVNIASIAGLTSFPLPVYGPMKSAVIMLTQILARDWARAGVRVNAIAPGFVLTPLQERLFEMESGRRDNLLRYVPEKEFIMPEDIAYAAVFLCSKRARFITGVTLPVDGGALTEGVWSAYGYH